MIKFLKWRKYVFFASSISHVIDDFITWNSAAGRFPASPDVAIPTAPDAFARPGRDKPRVTGAAGGLVAGAGPSYLE
jgi:hypothetical protein